MADTQRERTTLRSVVTKFKAIAVRDYDNKIFDNVLAIFNKLNSEEKRVFLRGLANIILLVEDNVPSDSPSLRQLEATVEAVQETVQETVNVEQVNSMELVKLKSWAIKTVIVMLMGGIITTVLMVVYLSGGQLNKVVDMKAVDEWSKIAKTMLGIMK